MSATLRRPRLSAATPGTVENRDPAASMVLLLDTMRHPLDPSYEAAALRKQGDIGGANRSGRRSVELAVIAMVTVLLGFFVGSAVTALQVPKNVTSDARSQLISQIEQKQRDNDARLGSLTSMRHELSSARQQKLARTSDKALKVEVSRAEQQAGASPGQGPGVEVVLANPESPDGTGHDSDPRTGTNAQALTSRDLQRVVNGLWQAGATAIAINDQRLTSWSAIRFAGSAILVNYRPLTTPYVVRAIGPSSLAASFKDDDGGRYLASLGRHQFHVDVRQPAHVKVPSGLTPPGRYATVRK